MNRVKMTLIFVDKCLPRLAVIYYVCVVSLMFLAVVGL